MTCWLKKLFYFAFAAALFSSCTSMQDTKVFANVMTFSGDVNKLYMKNYDFNEGYKVQSLWRGIENLTVLNNETAEYYAMDIALDEIQNRVLKKKDKETKYYLILLTDGLDNVSLEMARKDGRGVYDSLEAYADSLNKRMNTILNKSYLFGLVQNENIYNTFQSWPIMFFGDDMKSSGYEKKEAMELLKPLAGAQNTFTPNPIVEEETGRILELFKQQFVVTQYSFLIPKGYVEKRVKMSFYDKNGKNATMEADFKRIGKDKFGLSKIKTSENFFIDTKDSDIIISDESGDGENSAVFTIDNLRLNEKPYSIKSAKQEYYENGKFRTNSEFDDKAGMKKNAYILLVLDTSKSLGSQASNVKKLAQDIILYINTEICGE